VHDIKRKQMIEIQERGFQIETLYKKEKERKLDKIKVSRGFL